MLFVILAGIVGFMYIEDYNALEAFYMTVITVATVGFSEVKPLTEAGRIFTAILIITSFGTFAYAITALTKYVVDGELRQYFKNYQMNTLIEKLSGHIVVCGYGRNGRQAAHVLKNHNKQFLVIEKNKEIIGSMQNTVKDLLIEGDATQDEILKKASLEKASAIITTLPEDADNLFIVLSAKAINPNLTIISRASDDNSDKKLKIAGATNVIMPDKIGGAHMASLVLKPDVIEFVDFITGQGGDNIRLDEVVFDSFNEKYIDQTIGSLDIRSKTGANIVGFKTQSGDYTINPSSETKIIKTLNSLFLVHKSK